MDTDDKMNGTEIGHSDRDPCNKSRPEGETSSDIEKPLDCDDIVSHLEKSPNPALDSVQDLTLDMELEISEPDVIPDTSIESTSRLIGSPSLDDSEIKTPPVQPDTIFVPPPSQAAQGGLPSAGSSYSHQASGRYKIDLHLQFPNGSVNKNYDTTKYLVIRPRTSGSPTVAYKVICDGIHGLDSLGLSAEVVEEKIRIRGIPVLAGDHKLIVHYSLFNREQCLGRSLKEVILTVNPDPRSLWKDIEPQEGLPFRKPHTSSEKIEGDLVIVGASRRGRSHAHEGKFREDDFRIGYDHASGWSFMVVADGAGSALLSRHGSQLACEAAAAALVPYFTSLLGTSFDEHAAAFANSSQSESPQVGNTLYKVLGNSGHAAFKRLEQEAKALGCPLKALATTLNITLCHRYRFGWFVAVFAIGDGGVGLFRKGDSTIILSQPDSGEFAGQTRFLTMSEIWSSGKGILDRIKYTVVPDMTALIAMTDGISDPFFTTDKNFFDSAQWELFWDELCKSASVDRDNAHLESELLDWLDFWSKGNHDDRTIAIMLP